jgi:hypothetical protein
MKRENGKYNQKVENTERKRKQKNKNKEEKIYKKRQAEIGSRKQGRLNGK